MQVRLADRESMIHGAVALVIISAAIALCVVAARSPSWMTIVPAVIGLLITAGTILSTSVETNWEEVDEDEKH